MPDIDLSRYYTVKEAAAVLSKNSGKIVSAGYVRILAKRGQISKISINERFNVYPREDIDNYIVEHPGTKSVRARKLRKGQHA